ncbi:MAG: hypothetical protein H7Z39_20625 [Burkholderiaceae bacterium]|nr:hypothetical protein [Burkholderiaceae bacterium]
MKTLKTPDGTVVATGADFTYSDSRKGWDDGNGMCHGDYERALVVVAVSHSIEPLQGLLALDAAGLAGAYEQWASDPARTFAEKAFIERAQVWRRDDPLLQAAMASLGMTPAQGDDLFSWAATL